MDKENERGTYVNSCDTFEYISNTSWDSRDSLPSISIRSASLFPHVDRGFLFRAGEISVDTLNRSRDRRLRRSSERFVRPFTGRVSFAARMRSTRATGGRRAEEEGRHAKERTVRNCSSGYNLTQSEVLSVILNLLSSIYIYFFRFILTVIG